MKKLITGVISAAALAVGVISAAALAAPATVPATPAVAIHHGTLPFVPECATSANSLGVPAFNNGLPPNALGVSNTVLPGAAGAHAQGGDNCANNR